MHLEWRFTYFLITGNHFEKTLGVVDTLEDDEALASLTCVLWRLHVVSSEEESAKKENVD